MTTTQHKNERRKRSGGGELVGSRMAVIKSKLDFSKFAYRWLNDVPGRIHAKTKEDDWDIVMNDGVKHDADDLGNAVSLTVGTKPDGKPMMAYLCRKPRSYFDDDQAEKSASLDEQLSELKRGNDRAGGSQSDYIPSTGIKMM